MISLKIDEAKLRAGLAAAIAATGGKPAPGIPCPNCGRTNHRTIYTRQRAGMTVRRRECKKCGRRFRTVERLR